MPTFRDDEFRVRHARHECPTVSARERFELDADDRRWLDDELMVVRWRTQRLTALGYELPGAALLAFSDVDVHELERLIGKGCPPATALRIAA